MTDIKQLAKNLRRYKRRKLIERLREAAAQRVASTAMIGADDLIAAADALEIATAGMNAYCDELGSCRKAAGFGSADDPMAQEGVGAFSDPLCVAAFVESQFKRIVAERDALAAELKALREQKPVARIDDDESFQGPCRHAMAFVPMHRGSPLYAHPVPSRELTDEEILNALDGKVGTQFLTTPVTCKEFWLTAGSVDVRELVRAIEAAIKGEGK